MNIKTYQGKRHTPGSTIGPQDVFVEEDGKRSLLEHHTRHSPDGFNWGYGGSGPAELALAILWDFLGHEPSTPLYQQFKWEFVARWGDEWRITEQEIHDWLAQQRQSCAVHP